MHNVKPSIFAGMSLWTKIKYGGTALFIVGMLGFSALMMKKAQANIVLFENSLDSPGELTLNGKSYGNIAPRQHIRVELDAGSYTLAFAGSGKALDEGKLVVPDNSKQAWGYRAVYNLGGRKGLGVATKFYGGNMKDGVVPAKEGQRVIEVPGAQTLDRIDDTFPETITVRKNQSFGSVVRVCHIDEEKETVSCPGW
ncbi:MAG: hypothetical protein ACOY0T_31510 [Myxococcota bacterium]